MDTLRLVIGNKNYSSWSLRPWLVLRHLALPFEEEIIPLFEPNSRVRLQERSPSGRVPVLYDGDLGVWDSLAICEYLAERFPQGGLWPSEPRARAVARSLSHEMHSGFSALRTHLPMNVRTCFAAPQDAPGVADDVARVQEIWRSTRERFGAGGDFLFGEFCIADAMYAPVAFRFQTYNVALSHTAHRYRDTLLALPAMAEWARAAASEPWTIDSMEK